MQETSDDRDRVWLELLSQTEFDCNRRVNRIIERHAKVHSDRIERFWELLGQRNRVREILTRSEAEWPQWQTGLQSVDRHQFLMGVLAEIIERSTAPSALIAPNDTASRRSIMSTNEAQPNSHDSTPRPGITSITPSIADEWLQRSDPRDRNPEPEVVRRYVAALHDDKLPNHQQVVTFDEDGTLINGTHMLKTCVDSGVTVEAMVAVGISNEALASVDTGNKKTEKPATLTLVMAVGGDGESDEPVAVYTDPVRAKQAAANFNRQYNTRVWECSWQYTKEVPYL